MSKDYLRTSAVEERARRAERLATRDQELQRIIGAARLPNTLWLSLGVLVLISCVAMAAPMDTDGVNAHATLGLYFIVVLPVTVTMLTMGARIVGFPLVAGVIAMLVLLHRGRAGTFDTTRRTPHSGSHCIPRVDGHRDRDGGGRPASL
jgi:hypothetical protein